MKLPNDLIILLKEIESKTSKNFSGLGLVIYKKMNNLPIASLKSIDSDIHLPIISRSEIITFLSNTSTNNNKYHDGFHLLNENLELTHISQYISPPIDKKIKTLTMYGSRYMTELNIVQWDSTNFYNVDGIEITSQEINIEFSKKYT